MIALDTNIVVRIVTRDDPEQLQAAVEIMRSGDLWLPKTVLLETEWVLRYSYGLDRQKVLRALRAVLGYPPLDIEDRATVLRALEGYAAGMDFADALHLASSHSAEHFATFDCKLASAARRAGARPPVELLSS